MAHIFISYVRENKTLVDRLCKDLHSHGLEVWLDRNKITPGQRWKDAIRNAIQCGAFFIGCFSQEYNKKDSSYMNAELTLAIEELRKKSTDRVWFIPVLLSPCEVPNRSIGAGETLRDFQWVNLYENWNDGIKQILKVVSPIRDGSIEKNIADVCILTLDIIESTGSEYTIQFKEFILSTLRKFERSGFYYDTTGNDTFIAFFNSPKLLLDIAKTLLSEEERLKIKQENFRGTRKGLSYGNVTIIQRLGGQIAIKDLSSRQSHSIARTFCILEGIDEYCKSNKYDRNQVYIMDSVSAKRFKDELQLKILDRYKQVVKSKHFYGSCYVYPLI